LKEVKSSTRGHGREEMTGLRKHSLLVLILISAAVLPLFGQDAHRDSQLMPEALLDSIGVRPGMIIGEAGAGQGYFTFKLANRVGPTGHVYANDIDEGALKVLWNRAQREGIAQITTVKGEVADPLFPVQDLDMVVLVVAFHDFEKPVAWLKKAARYMKSGANLVIIDVDPDRWGRGHYHYWTLKKISGYLETAGYRKIRVYTHLPRHNIYIYRPKRK
jgi:ubiquinone/menaquinone biosynthesis C-methylase UbiE